MMVIEFTAKRSATFTKLYYHALCEKNQVWQVKVGGRCPVLNKCCDEKLCNLLTKTVFCIVHMDLMTNMG